MSSSSGGAASAVPTSSHVATSQASSALSFASSGASGPDWAALGDTFDNAGALSGWLDQEPQRHAVETQGGLDVGVSRAGHLMLAPSIQAQNHWYADNHGAMVARTITGDFVMEVDVTVENRAGTALPNAPYNAAGLLLRDPASQPGAERWVMYNLGFQDGFVAREVKTTRPGTGGSLSTLYLMEVNPPTGRVTLRACRVGSMVRFFHRMDGSPDFTEETFVTGGTQDTVALGNGAFQPTPGVVLPGNPDPVIRFDRPDLPQTLHAGLIAGVWEVGAGAGVRGVFDAVRFGPAPTAASCLAGLP